MNERLKILSTNSDIRSFLGEYPIIAGSIRLTNACNLQCPHCYTNGGKALLNELSLGEIKSVIDQFSELKTLYLFFTGGEPFIRRDIVEILQHTFKKKIGISLSTNGQFINKEILEKIKNIDFKLFQISLDGDENLHDMVRGKGVGEKAIDVIRLAKKILKRNVGVGTVMMKDNCRFLDKVLAEAVKQKADIFALMFLIVTGRADESLMPDPKEYIMALEAVFDKYKKVKSKISFAKNTTILPALIPKEWREKDLHKTFSPCSFPYCIGIDAKGDVAPCDGFFNCPEMIIGNIRNQTLKEMWSKSKIIKDIIKINPKDLKGICKKCIYRDYCAGGCRAYSYIKYKDLTMPDPVCQDIYEAGLFPKDCLR